MVGRGNNCHIIYLIDFGLSKRFIDYKTGIHNKYTDGKDLVGTVRYASINTHLGIGNLLV
jgi:serine/threonine protein kinase